MNYWEECIREAFEDSEIKATKEQIENVVGWVEGAHENYSMAMGHDCIPNPVISERDEWKKKYERERDKVVCEECWGRGRLTSYAGTFRADSRCHSCHGAGYIY